MPSRNRRKPEETGKPINEADGNEEEEEAEEQRRTNRFDPLWEGLGSLGERLARVDGRFDQLDREICHDREVSTSIGVRSITDRCLFSKFFFCLLEVFDDFRCPTGTDCMHLIG